MTHSEPHVVHHVREEQEDGLHRPLALVAAVRLQPRLHVLRCGEEIPAACSAPRTHPRRSGSCWDPLEGPPVPATSLAPWGHRKPARLATLAAYVSTAARRAQPIPDFLPARRGAQR